MGKLGAFALALVLTAMLGMATDTSISPAGETAPDPTAAPMLIWEAYSRGLATVHQVDVPFNVGGNVGEGPLGYQVRNTGAVEVRVDEYVVLLSPNPRDLVVPVTTTQDGALTPATVPAGSSLTYGYGDFVAQGYLPGPAWWCTEERQFVQTGVQVSLGGELVPFALEPIVRTLVPLTTQESVWTHLKLEASPVVGKTVDGQFWKEIPDRAGQTLTVSLRATNLAIRDDTDAIDALPDAPNARVFDVLPPGWTLEAAGTTPGYATLANPDGSTTIWWATSLPAADVTAFPAADQPTPYISRAFSYRMTTPALTPGRLGLPRAQVSAGADFAPEARSAQPLLDVFHVNAPPVAHAGPGYDAFEGDSITFSAAASSDPDGDALTFRWDFDADGAWDTPFSPDPTATLAFGDDVAGVVRVEVSDGEFSDVAEAPLTVRNLDPVLHGLRASSVGDLTLRVAGEKWHDVTLEVAQGGVSRSVSVVRMPGSPDRQAATLEDVEISLTDEVSITVYYTPDDDPVNGQRNGANPVWVLYTVGGVEVRLHHTFNVRHPATWTWSLEDLAAQFVGAGLDLVVEASDVGSDDLRFEVDWGDGTTSTLEVFNDGVGPDLPTSPDVNPIHVERAFSHAYAGPGAYTVTVTVFDDDGGSATDTLLIVVG